MSFSNILYTIILYPIVQVIEISFTIFDKLFDNTGIAVLGVSLTVTLLCLPLYIVAEHWQQVQRDTEAKLKPGVDRIKSVFKGDEQYMILSTYYKQNHYHPMMALRSSFGLLIQIPFFMAAYMCLSSLPALQGESFLFIRDMGQPDAIFTIGNFPINILPIAMTVINIIAGMIYTKGFALKEKIQIYGMALIFLVLLYNSPSGLVLYWTMNNVFSLIKNIFYKLKNPIKVLYYCMSAGVVFVATYILFIYDGGASTQKRLAAAIPLLLLLFVPLFIKGIKYFINNCLQVLVENKKLRLSIFIFSSLSLTLLTGLLLPSSLIVSSPSEFSNVGSVSNPNSFLLDSFFQSLGLLTIWPICIYFLFSKKIQTIIAFIFSIGLVTSIVNSFAFAGDYGSMDASLKFIDGFKAQPVLFLIINIIVSLLIIVLISFLFKKNKAKLISSLFKITAISFLIIPIVNIVKTNKEYKILQQISTNKEDSSLSHQFKLSKDGKNVVVFMLDRAESSYMEPALKDFNTLQTTFDGFTYYKNTVSCNGHTLIGVPGLYGGYEYTPAEMNKRSEELLVDKHNEALLIMPRILSEQSDFDVFASDLGWGNYNFSSDMSFTDSYPKINGKKLTGRYSSTFKKEFASKLNTENNLDISIKRNLLWLSFFRESLAILRPIIYYDGSWFSSETNEDINGIIESYSVLYYLPQITEISDTGDHLVMIDNLTTHSNADISFMGFIDKSKLSYPDSKSYYNFILSLDTLGNWFDYLKANDVYDNTRIIIVADHGIGFGDNRDEGFNIKEINGYHKDHLHPLLLVKDFDAQGPMKTDMTFMTNADVPTIALDGIVENPTNPFTGKLITNESKKDGVYVTTENLFLPTHSKSKKIFTVSPESWFRVKDNIYVDENWVQEIPND